MEANMPRAGKRTLQAQPLKKGAKIEFVRSLPMDMAAAEVVDLGESAGIFLTPHAVHGIRTQIRTATRKRDGARTAAPGKTVAGTPIRGRFSFRTQIRTADPEKNVAGTQSVEDLLRAVAGELGLGRAIAILEQQRAAVKTALGD
jgi:hypothetical protein